MNYIDPGPISLTEAIWGPDLATVTDDRAAVVDGDRTWTRTELAIAALSVADAVRGTDIVGLILENGAEFIAAYHGTLAAGAAVLALDPRAVPGEWTTTLAAQGIGVVIAGPAQRPHLPAGITVVTVGQGRAEYCPTPAGGGRTAVLAASSGTLGKPKQVVITHHNLVANLAQIRQLHTLTADDVVLAVTPLRHIYGMQMAMNHALLVGAPIVILPTPLTSAHVHAAISRYGVTVAYLVPSVIAELGAAGPVGPGTLRLVVSGGAPLPAAAAEACSAALGVPVVQGFGMTEAGCICFTPDGAPGPVTSVGIPVPGTDIRFVDPDTGLDAQPGELWVRGPQVTQGYLDDATATAALIDPDGWLHTGDLAIRDLDGHVSVVGRLKDIIKYKGHQVAPAELEGILMDHPAVTDAAVLGEPDPVAGEIPKAYVVLAESVPLPDILTYVAARVPPHKRIRLISQVTAIPRSAAGKVRRFDLADRPVTREPVLPHITDQPRDDPEPTPQPVLHGLRVLVTGGGRGLGREFALALSAAGASVLITGRNADTLSATAKAACADGGPIVWAVADVLDQAATARAMESFGAVDVLVNNAALPGPLGPTWITDPDDWWRAMETNVHGADLTTRVALPGMIARGQGRVITVVSNAGQTRWPNASAYSVSKAAQIKLVENLAAELRHTGVTVLAYDPGLINIGITRAHLDRGHIGEPSADHILDWTLRAQAEGRFGTIEQATTSLVQLAAGSADDHSGRYLTPSAVTDLRNMM